MLPLPARACGKVEFVEGITKKEMHVLQYALQKRVVNYSGVLSHKYGWKVESDSGFTQVLRMVSS